MASSIYFSKLYKIIMVEIFIKYLKCLSLAFETSEGVCFIGSSEETQHPCFLFLQGHQLHPSDRQCLPIHPTNQLIQKLVIAIGNKCPALSASPYEPTQLHLIGYCLPQILGYRL